MVVYANLISIEKKIEIHLDNVLTKEEREHLDKLWIREYGNKEIFSAFIISSNGKLIKVTITTDMSCLNVLAMIEHLLDLMKKENSD